MSRNVKKRIFLPMRLICKTSANGSNMFTMAEMAIVVGGRVGGEQGRGRARGDNWTFYPISRLLTFDRRTGSPKAPQGNRGGRQSAIFSVFAFMVFIVFSLSISAYLVSGIFIFSI